MFQFLPLIASMMQQKQQEEQAGKAREAAIRGQGQQAQGAAPAPQSIPMPQLGNPTQPKPETTMGNFQASGGPSEADPEDPMYKTWLANKQGGFGGY